MSARDELTTLILGKTAPRAADAILAAGYAKPRQVSTVGELDAAKAQALREAADKAMGPSDVLLDAATCRWIAMGLRERAAELSPDKS